VHVLREVWLEGLEPENPGTGDKAETFFTCLA
jgi:hypothetical protein